MIEPFVLLFIFFHTYVTFSLGTVNPPEYFNVGVMYPIQNDNKPFRSILNFAAIVLAFEDLNNKTDGMYDDILPDTYLRLCVSSPNDGFYYGSHFAHDMLRTDNGTGVKVNIGPYGPLALLGAAPTLQEAGGIPLIGYHLLPVPSIYYDAYAIAALVAKYFKWEKVTVFSDTSDDSRASSQFFGHYASSLGINILSSHLFDQDESDYSVEILEAKKIGARVFILFLGASVGSKLIEQGYQLHLFKEDVQIIGGEDMSLGSSWQSSGIDLKTVTPFLKGYLGVKFRWYSPSSALKSRFIQRWITSPPTNGYVDANGTHYCDNTTDYYGTSFLYQFSPNGDRTKSPVCAGINFTSYKNHTSLETELDELTYAYDATITAALGLHHMVYDLKISDPSPGDLMDYILHKLSFNGLTGKVSFLSDHEDFNLGGRGSGIVYEVVNFRSPDILNPANSSAVTWSDVFPTVISWHSENGFTPCEGITEYIENNPCFTFSFNTKKNDLPRDSPPPTIESMPHPGVIVFLRAFSAIGLLCVLVILGMTYFFRQRRLIRMSQPVMTYFTLGGLVLAYIRMIFTSLPTTEDLCVARMWFDHLGFQLIFATLFVRSWRVYLVAGTLKRTKVSDLKSSSLIGTSLLITILLLLASTFNSVYVRYVVVADTQFEYILQPACSYRNRDLISLIFVLDALVFIAALRYCWAIRKVSSSICNTAILVEALITSLVVIVSTFLVLALVDLEPLISQVFTSLVIGLLVSRILWIFQSQLLFNVMMGYELDRALILRKLEKSLFEFDISSTWLPGSKRISDLASDDSEQPKSNSRGGIETLEDRIMQRGLEKFSKLKNKAELDAEITRIKSDLHRYQIELVCLENMIFASEHDSKSQSERKSSHGQALPVPAGKDLRGESESIPQVQRASLKNELEEGERASFFASASRLEDVA